jgi:hypothetical protein
MEPFQEKIERNLKALSEGYNEEAITAFSVNLESILRYICEINQITIEKDKPTMEDFLTNLKSQHYITVDTLKKGNKYSQNPEFLRNNLLHGLKDVEDITDGIKIIIDYINFLTLLFRDVYFRLLIESFDFNNLRAEFYKLPNLRVKTISQIKNLIIETWINTSENFKENPAHRNELMNYKGKLIFTLQGMKPLKIPIEFSF